MSGNSERIKALEDCLSELVKVLQECSEDLSSYIDQEYSHRINYREQHIKFDRDMEIVLRAASLISKAKGILQFKT